jgi:hypothetical protein
MGRQGVAVHDHIAAGAVYDIKIGFPPDDQVLAISGPGTVPVAAPVEIRVLAAGQLTGPAVYRKV